MGQVILVEEDLNMLDLLSVQLKKLAGIESIPRKNAGDTIELLKLLPKVNLKPVSLGVFFPDILYSNPVLPWC